MVIKHTAAPGLTIYPNPAKNEVTVSFTGTSGVGPGELVVTDAAGRKVIQRSIKVQSGYNSYTISVLHLAAALYFVTLKDGGKQAVTEKLVKW